MKSACKLYPVLAALGIVCLGWTTAARAAYLTTDGDFGLQTDNGAALVAPWNYLYGAVKTYCKSASQSPFTNVYANNGKGAFWTNELGCYFVNGFTPAISSNATGKLYMNIDFMMPYSGVGGCRICITDSGLGATVFMNAHSSGFYMLNAGSTNEYICPLVVGEWYNIQFTLDMDANTYSGAIVNASTSERFNISSRPFMGERDISVIFTDHFSVGLPYGAVGGRIDNWVLSTNELPAPPYIDGNIKYVAQAGQTSAAPFLSWTTAASNINDAIAAASVGQTVLVSNGVYDTGGAVAYGTITNRVYINKAITVRSANNDPAHTIIKGATCNGTNGPGAIRCVAFQVGAAASLIGFTLTNGATYIEAGQGWDNVGGGVIASGSDSIPIVSNCVITCNQAQWYSGGAWCCRLYNCVLSGNYVQGGDGHGGGGAVGGVLINCLVTNNSTYMQAGFYGGGVQNATVSNCTIIGNRAGDGGGVSQCTVYDSLIAGNVGSRGGGGAILSTLYNSTVVGNRGDGTYWASAGGVDRCNLINSILYFNEAPNTTYPNWNDVNGGNTFTNCCATPAPTTNGINNISADPKFVASGSGSGTNLIFGNYRLSGNSPCINTGTNQTWWMAGAVDLDGRQRIRYGTVDMGAYEYLRPGAVFGFR